MGRKIEDPWIGVESVLCSVSMMDVPVYDQDPLKGEMVDGIIGANGHVVKETESHGPISFRMMARRPHQGKTVFQVSIPDRLDQLAKAPGGQEGSLKGPGRGRGIHIQPEIGFSGGGFDSIKIDGGMGRLDLFPGGWTRFYVDQRQPPLLPFKHLINHL